jgi:solute carrier family 35 protein
VRGVGAVIAGLGDLSFNAIGYFLCALNCVVTALYLVFIAKVKNETNLDTFGLMFYNNVLSIPFVVLVVLGLEYEDVINYPYWTDPGFLVPPPPATHTRPPTHTHHRTRTLGADVCVWCSLGVQLCFIMSSVQAFLLNYFIFLCSLINSPLTTSVTGQIKNIFTTGIGLFIFGDVQISFLLSVGLLLATIASVWYHLLYYSLCYANLVLTAHAHAPPHTH